MMRIALKESKRDARREADTAQILGLSSYFRLCEAMVDAIGFELGPAVRTWLQARGVVAPGSWPAHLASWVSAEDETKAEISDFLELKTSVRAVAMVSGSSRRSATEAPGRQLYLVCRPTSDAAQAVLRPLRDRQALAFNRNYLVGTPEQLTEWCGNLRARESSAVRLNFFGYSANPAVQSTRAPSVIVAPR